MVEINVVLTLGRLLGTCWPSPSPRCHELELLADLGQPVDHPHWWMLPGLSVQTWRAHCVGPHLDVMWVYLFRCSPYAPMSMVAPPSWSISERGYIVSSNVNTLPLVAACLQPFQICHLPHHLRARVCFPLLCRSVLFLGLDPTIHEHCCAPGLPCQVQHLGPLPPNVGMGERTKQ